MPDRAIDGPGTNGDWAVALGLFALALAGGVALGSAAVSDFSSARASASWPVVDGVVLSKGENDAADIRYAYVAGGRGRESRRVRFLSGLVYAAPTDALRAGESVKVYVDPDRPEASVLRPGGSGVLFALAAALAGLLVFIGLGGVIRTLIVWRRSGVAG